jgi:ribosomal protein RSM22 (predicted rRNA methylase)
MGRNSGATLEPRRSRNRSRAGDTQILAKRLRTATQAAQNWSIKNDAHIKTERTAKYTARQSGKARQSRNPNNSTTDFTDFTDKKNPFPIREIRQIRGEIFSKNSDYDRLQRGTRGRGTLLRVLRG